jgi:hypothetical protein
MKYSRIFLGVALLSSSLMAEFSCKCKPPKITHIDFCDFANDVSNEWDRLRGSRVYLEKSIHFIVEEPNRNCLRDSLFINFMRTDSFLQKELKAAYYRLELTFYMKSASTDALLESRSTKFLSYCNKDMVIEYEWLEGKLSHVSQFKNGEAVEAKDIEIKNIDKPSEDKIKTSRFGRQPLH